jgi:hypothetical protein
VIARSCDLRSGSNHPITRSRDPITRSPDREITRFLIVRN